MWVLNFAGDRSPRPSAEAKSPHPRQDKQSKGMRLRQLTVVLYEIAGGGGVGGIGVDPVLEQANNVWISIDTLVSTFIAYGLVSNYRAKP